MNTTRRSLSGVFAVALGVTVYVVQMFVGLNDDSEYSDPWYLQAARWVALGLVIGGVLWSVGEVARSRGSRS